MDPRTTLGYSSVMLQIVVEVAGTVYDVDCSIFLKQLIASVLQQLIEVWHVKWAEAESLAAAEKCVYALAVRRRDKPAPHGFITAYNVISAYCDAQLMLHLARLKRKIHIKHRRNNISGVKRIAHTQFNKGS